MADLFPTFLTDDHNHTSKSHVSFFLPSSLDCKDWINISPEFTRPWLSARAPERTRPLVLLLSWTRLMDSMDAWMRSLETMYRWRERPTEEQIGTLNLSTQDNSTAPGWIEEDDHVVDFNQGMMDDDGTTLLKRKPSRLSHRWSRMSSRKGKYDKFSSEKELDNETNKPTSVDLNPEVPPATQTLGNSKEPEPTLHFSEREHADDQILITGKKEGEREMEDTRKEKTEGKLNGELMEDVKRNTLKNYRKVRFSS